MTGTAGLLVGIISVLLANYGGELSRSSGDLLTAVFRLKQAEEPGGEIVRKMPLDQENRVFWDYSGGGFQIIEENSFEAPVIENHQTNYFKNLNLEGLSGKAANELVKRQALEVPESGVFKAEEKITRAEAVKTILLVKNRNWQNIENKGLFQDLEDEVWYTKYMMNAAYLGMVAGDSHKNLKPLAHVNTAEFVKMMAVGFDMPLNLSFTYEDVSHKDWFAPYVGAAQKYQLFPEKRSLFEPNMKITREQMVVAIYQYLLNRKF